MSFVKSRNQNTISLKIFIFNFPPSSRVSPIAVPPSHSRGNPRRLRSRGTLDAIDFVAIAIPSLRSLRFSHNSRHFPYYATRSQAKKQHSLAHLYDTSSPTLDSVVALRLRFRLRFSVKLIPPPKKASGGDSKQTISRDCGGSCVIPA